MQDIKKKLINIPADYKPAPFWSWNDKLEPEELKRQIQWMHEVGIGGFFMHARGGLKTSYMSDEWMECIAACCDEAEKLGMNAWGYDENGWPSGFAGGKLLENEENRDRYILYNKGSFDTDADVSYLIAGDKLVRVNEGTQNGEYLNLSIERSVSTVDVLNPDVVKQFISLTHEKYKAYYGDEFSHKFKGFFTDEPQFYRGGGTPYSTMMETYFKENYGEDIYDNLGLLFVKKEGFRTFRYRYWLGMQTLLLNSYAKQIYDWCEENKVEFTGHYIAEDVLGPQLACCGGIMPFYEYMHIPGVDWLSTDTCLELGPRQVSSVARQMGKEHILTETFAGCGWNCSPEEFRRIAGFQYANGVNMMCHHLMPYSEHGQRKRDYPAHFVPINPWIKEHFKDFNDYFTRLGYLLATGEEPVRVAMLHPIRSTYFEYQQDKEAEGFGVSELEQNLRESMRTLSSRGISFHFLDETLLEKHGFVEGKQIGCGKCSYDYLILPSMFTMGKTTERLLHDFVRSGGNILLMGEMPQYLEGEPYDYEYLQSNCTMEDILAEQPFCVKEVNNDLYYAYRVIDGKPFLFVQNASETQTYIQDFQFADGSQSFAKYNPVTLEYENIPMTITVHENESLLLFPIAKQMVQTQEKQEVELTFHNAEVEFEHNYLTIDEVYFSKDGENYCGPLYVNTLFQQLLEERYNGKLWIKYCFEIEHLPETLSLVAEKNNTVSGSVNGHSVTFTEKWEDDSGFCIADILPFVQLGKNAYEIVMDWHQSEATYYALFGENVTESLKNCICYEGEIEAVYLRGDFGVYSHSEFSECGNDIICGCDFHIGESPRTVDEPIRDGFPFFRGKLKLSQNISLDTKNVILHVMGRFLTARVWVNEHDAGELLFGRRIDISPYAIKGENHIEVEFTIGNHNLFGPLHWSGKDWILGPWHFDVVDSTKYKLHQFHKKG